MRQGLKVIWALALAGIATAAQAAGVLVESDERSLATGQVIFQRGVFRVEPDGKEVSMLCLPTDGKWKYLGSGRDCGNPPPPHLQREIARYPEDVTFFNVLNLGISNEQWDDAKRQGKASTEVLRSIGEAFSFQVGTNDVRWHFQSAKLPRELKTPIPGAAIAFHFGHRFSGPRRPLLLAPDGDLLVETALAMPRAATTGEAHTGVTIAVDLEVPTTSGQEVGLVMIVNVFHPEARSSETIRSDGRVSFGSSYLGPGTKYVVAVANARKSDVWKGFERFAFKFTRESLRRLVTEANAKGVERGGTKFVLDPGKLDQIRVTGVTVRNENRRLDKGSVDVEVAVDYLRLARTSAR